MSSEEHASRWLINRMLSSLFIMCIVTARASAQIDDSDIPESLMDITFSDVETWEAPEEMQKSYPYYLSGFDYENRPVWIMEFGKWDILRATEQGEDHKAMLQKYVNQFMYRIIKSIGDKATEDDPVRHLVIIYDMDGFSFKQIASPDAISFHLATVRRILGLVRFVHTAYCVNTNYVATSLLNIMRPLLGESFNKVQIFGTNSARWIPLLLKQIPQSQLPQWYGGAEDFKPLKVYG